MTAAVSHAAKLMGQALFTGWFTNGDAHIRNIGLSPEQIKNTRHVVVDWVACEDC